MVHQGLLQELYPSGQSHEQGIGVASTRSGKNAVEGSTGLGCAGGAHYRGRLNRRRGAYSALGRRVLLGRRRLSGQCPPVWTPALLLHWTAVSAGRTGLAAVWGWRAISG